MQLWIEEMMLKFHPESWYGAFPSGKTFYGLPKIFVGEIKCIEKPTL